MKYKDIIEFNRMFGRADRIDWLQYVVIRLPPREMADLLMEITPWTVNGKVMPLDGSMEIHGIKIEVVT